MTDAVQDCPTMPRLNEPASAFEAKTTHGVKKLSDYKGKWLVIFSHPADFTPVCTTEFMTFAKHYPEFQQLNCELIGLSIESYYAHVAWVRNIKEKFGVDIPFPIIDDKGILRTMVYYPMTNGRSIPEFVRLMHWAKRASLSAVVTQSISKAPLPYSGTVLRWIAGKGAGGCGRFFGSQGPKACRGG